jgi:multicomponent Na+:H+ antiporter subunit D
MQMQHLILLPVILPLVAGALCIALPGLRARQVVGVVAGVLQVMAAGWFCYLTAFAGTEARVLVSQMGNWPAPFGISVVIDPVAAIFLLAASLVVLAVVVFTSTDHAPQRQGGFLHAGIHFVSLGVNWSLTTGDLFNLFVAFEVMLIASYLLLVHGTSTRQMRHAYKYILLNLVGSMLFVMLCGLVYGSTGTLNFADLTRMAAAGGLNAGAVVSLSALVLVFGLKSALFPLWFWLPETYPTLQAVIAGLLGGLLTKVGAYCLLRVFVMVLGAGASPIAEYTWPVLGVTAAVTMFLGVLGAASRMTVRSILSIHIISQVGYMAMGITLALHPAMPESARVIAVAATVFFIAHNMIVKSALFLCGGLIRRVSGDDDLHSVSGLLPAAPMTGVLFFIAAISLAGLPPSSGFWGKLVIIREAVGAGVWPLTALAVVAVVTSLLTLFSMLKIWTVIFWGPASGKHEPNVDGVPAESGAMRGPIVATSILVVTAITMGLAANVYFAAATRAASVLIDREPYVRAVLDQSGVVPGGGRQALEVRP